MGALSMTAGRSSRPPRAERPRVFVPYSGPNRSLLALRGDESDRVTLPPPRASLDDAVDAFDRGAFADALELAQTVLAYEPDSALASELARDARARLRAECLAELGGVLSVPRVVASLHSLEGDAIDARAAFVATRMDGSSTLGDVLDMSGMDDVETLRIVCDLVRLGIVAIDRQDAP